jgi:hypothetical protein
MTSKSAHIALQRYLAADETLRKEIEAKIGPLPGLEDIENDIQTYEQEDDSDVPSTCVVKDALGLDLPDTDDGGHCVPAVATAGVGEFGYLSAVGRAEDIWDDAEHREMASTDA